MAMNIKKFAFFRLAAALGTLATVIVSTASWSYVHQDETPAELLK